MGLGHGIAVFVGNAAFDHRCGLQTDDEILDLLACAQREHAAFSVATVLVHFLEAGALDKQAIAAGRDVFDVKATIHAGEGCVVCAFALGLSDQFDESFLYGLAAGIFGDGAGERSLRRRRSLRGG